MNRQEALSLLDAHLDQYRKLSYGELAAKIGDEEFPEIVGPSGSEYQMEIQIRWDHEPGGDVRVMGTIDDGTFRGAFKPVCSDLIVRPEDRDLDDGA
jgi:hypothetical protein